MHLTWMREEEAKAEARVETREQNILERVRAFGKWPLEHDYSQANSQEILTVHIKSELFGFHLLAATRCMLVHFILECTSMP